MSSYDPDLFRECSDKISNCRNVISNNIKLTSDEKMNLIYILEEALEMLEDIGAIDMIVESGSLIGRRDFQYLLHDF